MCIYYQEVFPCLPFPSLQLYFPIKLHALPTYITYSLYTFVRAVSLPGMLRSLVPKPG